MNQLSGGQLFLIVVVGLIGLILLVPATALIAVYYAGKALIIHFRAAVEAFGLAPGDAVLVPEPPPARTAEGAEPAYPQYLFGQVRQDIRGALTGGIRSVRDSALVSAEALLVEWFDRIPLIPSTLWRRLTGIMLLAGLAIGTLAGLLVIAVFTVVQVVVMTLCLGLALGGILVLRVADSALLRLRGIRIICPTCGERIPYPSYTCAGCHTLHRDVRPGRYGVVRRACACGEYRMPTLLLLGSHRMDAYCPDEGCERPLAPGTGTTPEWAIPFAGDRNAGKTRLMAAMVLALTDPSRPGPVMTFTREADRVRFEDLRRALQENQPTRNTLAGLQPAYSLRSPTGSPPGVIHLFDTAGERFQDSARILEMRHLAESRSFLFVLNPLSIPRIWKALRPEERERLTPFRAIESPKFVLDQMIANLQRLQLPLPRFRLGVVVSKADLLAETSVAGEIPPPDNASVQSWLDRLELDDLLRTARAEFGQTRFFLTSARLTGGRVDQQVLELTEWAVATSGMRLRPGRRAA